MMVYVSKLSIQETYYMFFLAMITIDRLNKKEYGIGFSDSACYVFIISTSMWSI